MPALGSTNLDSWLFTARPRHDAAGSCRAEAAVAEPARGQRR
jgi:hypothetical protein